MRKYKQIKKSYTKKIIYGFLPVLFLCILISNSNIAHAEYTDNITINGEMDLDYKRIAETDNYTIYYANNDVNHFFYMIFSFNVSEQSVEIKCEDFEYDLTGEETQTSFLHSIIKNKSLEISTSRDVLGNNLQFIFKDVGISILLMVNPSKQAIDVKDTSDTSEEDEDTSDSEDEPTLLGWIDNRISNATVVDGFFLGAFLVGIFSIFLFMAWRLKLYPIMVFLNGDSALYEAIKLGRYMKQERSKTHLKGYWKITLKNGWKGVLEVYSTENVEEIRERQFRKVNVIQEEYPLYSYKTLKLSEEDQFKKEINKDTTKNKIIYGLLRFVCRVIPNNKLTLKLDSMLERDTTDEIVTEIKILQFDKTMKKVKTVCTIEYSKYITTKKGKELKEGLKLKKVPLYEVLDLMKDENVVKDSIKYKKVDIEIIPIRSLKEAIEKDNESDELRTIFAYEEKYAEKKYAEVISKYNSVRSTLKEKDRELERKVLDIFQNANFDKTMSKVDFLGKVLGKMVDGTEIKESIKQAELEFKESNYKEAFKQLEYDGAKKDAIIEQQEKFISSLQKGGNGGLPNTINLKDTFEEE